jgi:magnesium transporter
MDVRFVATATDIAGPRALSPVTEHAVDELTTLLGRDDGVVWVDIPTWDEDAERVLAEVFCAHPLAIRDCMERNQVPKVHLYPDHVFLVLHAPVGGKAGHVHYIELDQFVGPNYLITVHGPLNPAVDPVVATVEVQSLLHRLESGRLRPRASYELSHAMVSALTGRLRSYTAHLTQDVWSLEQRVTAGHLGDPEKFLEEMFRARHGLLTVQTMAALSREVYARMAKIEAFGPGRAEALVEDTVDQFDRLRAMAHGQKDYLQGTIEFYQARTNTKMTIAAERLAVIAAVTLPITALSSILGMNVIVNDETKYGPLAIALTIMIVMSTTLLIWAKRKGWW